MPKPGVPHPVIRCWKSEAEVAVESRRGRPRYTERITFQVSRELRNQLTEMSERDHGGDIQALGRQCLQAWVDGNGGATARMDEVLGALERFRREVARQNQEAAARLEQQLHGNGGATARMDEVLEALERFRREVARQNQEAAARLEQQRDTNVDLAKAMSLCLTDIMAIRDNLQNWATRSPGTAGI